VEQHIDALAALAYLVYYFGDRFRVGEVDAEVVGGPSGVADGVDGGLGRLRALQRGQFLFDQRRGGALASCLNTREEFALQPFSVDDEALEVGIIRIGLGN
jgi:hypothetical protein